MLEFGLGATGGFLLRLLVVSRRKPKALHPCPWAPCGYPLPDEPLTARMETANQYATYLQEECPGCGNAVLWTDYKRRYLRVVKTP